MNELFSDEYAKKLENLAKDNAERYANGKPFPHIYFDDFLPIESAEAALKAFPEPKQLTWTEFDSLPNASWPSITSRSCHPMCVKSSSS